VLRGGKLNGRRFRRQQVIAGFMADFFCNEARLAVELDGEIHANWHAYDQARDAVFAQHEVRVLRLTNDQVLNNMPAVLSMIRLALSDT
jgi:very-short-patch-repair endonuclease